ncbi:MAG: hypothetical protein IPJ74_07925 [Saprospiraceae bacterium]|nr:hypothetical protein [Saprospiraceae bacterium]
MIDIPHEYFAIIAVLFFFIAGAFMMYYWGRHTWKEIVKTPVFIAFSLLALTVFVNIMQTIILKTPNLTTRTALSFYPLFVLLISAVLYHIQQSKNLITQIAGTLLLVFSLWHMARTVSYDRVREWWYDANTFQVLGILKNNSNNNTISLQTGGHVQRSLIFISKQAKRLI